MSCPATHKLIIKRSNGVVVSRQWIRFEDGLEEQDPAVIALLENEVDDDGSGCFDPQLILDKLNEDCDGDPVKVDVCCKPVTYTPVVLRTTTAGVLPAVSSYSIAPVAGDDWILNGVAIPGTHAICQGVEDCNCIEAGISYDPDGGELLISYIECNTL